MALFTPPLFMLSETLLRSARSPDARWLREGLVCLAIACFFIAWYAPGVIGGQVHFAEDTAAYFFSNRAVLYTQAHADGFQWWDPLPGLGQPRLANIQNGSLAPLSTLFYLLPTERVFTFYAAICLTLLALFSYGLFRVKGVGRIGSLFGALSFTTMGNVTTHVQHPPVIETLVWLPATLLAWELYLRTEKGWWAALAAYGVAFQCYGASPQFLIYNGLLMTFWIGGGLWAERHDRHRLFRDASVALGIAVAGLCLASWQLLPSLEFAQMSHRGLLSSAETFRNLYRAAPHEVLLALAAEVFWFVGKPGLVHAALYTNLPNLSLLTVALATMAAIRFNRGRATLMACGLFLLGMLGTGGVVAPLLSAVIPFADLLRAPLRMIVPAGFLLSWLAAYGLHRVLQTTPRGALALGLVALAWIAGVGWTLKRPLEHYTDGAYFRVPEVIRNAEGRIAVDFASSRRLPLFSLNAGLAAGVPTLLMREVLIPENFFEAYFASQFGSLDQAQLLDRMITSAALPLRDANAPMMRAFGLRQVIRFSQGHYETHLVDRPLARFAVVPDVVVEQEQRALWDRTASSSWDPHREVILREPLSQPGLARASTHLEDGETYGSVRLLSDSPDEEQLLVESNGGILVSSSLMFPGWSVQVDGRPAEAIEVNLAMRGVQVPPGAHLVEWRYRPTWLGAAIGCTVVAAAVLIGLILLPGRSHLLRVPNVVVPALPGLADPDAQADAMGDWVRI